MGRRNWAHSEFAAGKGGGGGRKKNVTPRKNQKKCYRGCVFCPFFCLVFADRTCSNQPPMSGAGLVGPQPMPRDGRPAEAQPHPVAGPRTAGNMELSMPRSELYIYI
jgi:hypothetical protein